MLRNIYKKNIFSSFNNVQNCTFSFFCRSKDNRANRKKLKINFVGNFQKTNEINLKTKHFRILIKSGIVLFQIL